MSAAARGVAPTLYRALLRAAKRFDGSHAHLRVILSRPRTTTYDMIKGSWSEPPTCNEEQTANSLAAAVSARAVKRVCGGARLYPGECSSLTVQSSIAEAIRHTLTEEWAPSMSLDAGFALLRRLEATAALGVRVTNLPPAHSPPLTLSSHEAGVATAATLTSGSLLVSHPLLRRDVVLLLSVAGDGVDGFCMGLVLNQPTAAQLGASPLLRGRGQTVGPARGSSSRTTARTRTSGSAAALDSSEPRLPLPSVSEMLSAAASGNDLSHRFPTEVTPVPDATPPSSQPPFKRPALIAELREKHEGRERVATTTADSGISAGDGREGES